jgi:hypothetical protein
MQKLAFCAKSKAGQRQGKAVEQIDYVEGFQIVCELKDRMKSARKSVRAIYT